MSWNAYKINREYNYYNKFQLKNKNSHRIASISKGDIKLKNYALTYY